MIQWCCSCRDGGDVVICTTCETSSVCRLCVDFKLEDEEDTISFECPTCYLKESSNLPYVSLS